MDLSKWNKVQYEGGHGTHWEESLPSGVVIHIADAAATAESDNPHAPEYFSVSVKRGGEWLQVGEFMDGLSPVPTALATNPENELIEVKEPGLTALVRQLEGKYSA